MKPRDYQVAFPAALFVVMLAFLSAIFFTNVNLAFAESGQKEPAADDRPSAVERVEAQIKQLEDELTISKAQEELWNNLTQVMRENAKDMDALTREREEAAGTMNSVEHMKFHSQITETHLGHMKKLIPPYEAFYDSMSDEQKTVADTVFRTGKYGKPRRK